MKQPKPERVGFLDIESTNLVADFGFMLTWAIKDGSSKKVLHDEISLRDLRRAKAGDEDKRIVASLIQAMVGFDRIVTFYGKRFDVPFIRTRADAMGLWFPDPESIYHTDAYDTVRHRYRLSSNRLENACRVLLGRTAKTRIEAKFWRGASRGDNHSIKEVLKHNLFDVLDLEKLFNKVKKHSKLKKSRL